MPKHPQRPRDPAQLPKLVIDICGSPHTDDRCGLWCYPHLQINGTSDPTDPTCPSALQLAPTTAASARP